MRGRIARAAGGLLITGVVSCVAATSVFAATPVATKVEVVAANFGKLPSATAYEAKLVKAGITGFEIRKENVGAGHYQVERTFTTKSAAMAEVAKLKAAHFRGGIERDTAGGV